MYAYLLLIIYLFIFYFKMLPEEIINGNRKKEIISSALLNKEEIF